MSDPLTAIPINQYEWTCDSRTTVPIPLTFMVGGGISFDFPVSPKPDPNAVDPWVTYFQAALDGKRPITGKTINYDFQVIADPNTTWNYMSDANNHYVGTPARFHAYIKQGALLDNGETARWWNKTPIPLVDSGGMVNSWGFSLDPENWINVDGTSETYPPYRAQFLEALKKPTYIGLTFGGGYFYGHGVNVSGGQARFQLMSVAIN